MGDKKTEMISEAEISGAIESFLKNSMGITIEPGATFASMGVDSMAILKILMFLEKELGIYVPDSELTWENIQSVATLSEIAFKVKSETEKG